MPHPHWIVLILLGYGSWVLVMLCCLILLLTVFLNFCLEIWVWDDFCSMCC